VGRPESSLVFIGFQAHGTLGREFVEGKKQVRIHGQQHEVKARVVQIHGFSAHADQSGLLKWLGHLKSPPRRVFLTHGEEDAALTLADMIRRRSSWDVVVPEYQDEHELD
jgi:metallo-beta-lactamase family protein